MPGNVRWSGEELQLIKDLYETADMATLREKLPNRSAKAITTMASKLMADPEPGPAAKRPETWAQEEIQFLKDNYKSMDYPELEERLHRTRKAIDCKVAQLGLKRKLKKTGAPEPSEPWTGDEENVLIRCAGRLTVNEIHTRYLKNRTTRAIQSKMRMLGLSDARPPKWTEQEREIIARNYKKPGTVLQDLLPGRSYGAIRNQLTAMRLRGLLE